jgi:hypothetical protein
MLAFSQNERPRGNTPRGDTRPIIAAMAVFPIPALRFHRARSIPRIFASLSTIVVDRHPMLTHLEPAPAPSLPARRASSLGSWTSQPRGWSTLRRRSTVQGRLTTATSPCGISPCGLRASLSILQRSHIRGVQGDRCAVRPCACCVLQNMVSHHGAQRPDAWAQLCSSGAAPVFRKSSADV